MSNATPTAHGSATAARPPGSHNALAAEQERLLACVHCGFCQDVCPTYTRLGDELDSPRGRLYLMRAVAEGRLDTDADAFVTHIDRCLGCRACEPVCPSGVEYGFLLERARSVAASARGIPFAGRVLLLVFGNRTLAGLAGLAGRALRAGGLAARLAKRLPARFARLRLALAMLAATRPARPPAAAAPAAIPRAGSARATTTRVAILDGCVQRGLLGHVNASTRRVLARAGYTLTRAPGQRCCGALHAHAGDLGRARSLALANIDAFERSGANWIAVNAAGCGAAMKHYGELLEHSPHEDRARAFGARVRDVAELLDVAASPADHDSSATEDAPAHGQATVDRAEPALRVAYDAPCHLIHAQGIARAPIDVLLRAVPWLEEVPLERAEECCGGAGLYGLTQATLGRRIGEDKVRAIQNADLDIVLTANAGCLMQIGAELLLAGDDTPVMHTISLLDACTRPHGRARPLHR